MLGWIYVCQVVRWLNFPTDARNICCFSLSGSPNPLPEKFVTNLDMKCARKSVVCKRNRVNKLGDLKQKSLTFSNFLG